MAAMTPVAAILRNLVPEKATSILPCACGGRVRADRRFPTVGVQHHNRTKRHQAWRKAREA